MTRWWGKQLMDNENQVCQFLDELGISYEVIEHRAVFTVAEIDFETPGSQVKNLLLKSPANQFFLLILDDRHRADLKGLAAQLGQRKLSFASDDELFEHLGVKPGAVTPFGLLNDVGQDVRLIIDNQVDQTQVIGFHPNVNTKTLILRFSDFLAAMKRLKHVPQFVTAY